jgi:prepilin signal peptidase PulO-like enzyme (type II secretory pathway)
MLDRLVLVIPAALVGWCLGWLSAWLTNWLQLQDELPSSAHGPLVQDVLVQASSATVWAAALLAFDSPRWVIVGLLAVPLIQVTVTDIRHRYVYTSVAAIGLLLGVGLGWLAHASGPLDGVLDALKGALGGGLAFGGFYLLGLLLGRVRYGGQEAMARGDVTIAAMVGAVAGACTASTLFLGMLLSAVLAVGVGLSQRSLRVYMPFGPGLCLAGLVSLFRC